MRGSDIYRFTQQTMTQGLILNAGVITFCDNLEIPWRNT